MSMTVSATGRPVGPGRGTAPADLSTDGPAGRTDGLAADEAGVDGAVPRVQVRRDSGLYGYERALKRVGLSPVAGADEAGRGACAGPLVAGAVILSDAKSKQISGLRDSKLLSAAQRERCYDQIVDRALA